MNCKTLEQRTIRAAQELNIDAGIVKITDYQQIAECGILHTPGLIIDDRIISQGRVPTVEQIKEILKQELTNNV